MERAPAQNATHSSPNETTSRFTCCHQGVRAKIPINNVRHAGCCVADTPEHLNPEENEFAKVSTQKKGPCGMHWQDGATTNNQRIRKSEA
ncbi:MAG: hypothetical protein ACRC0J_22235 [Shewanella oncorhynchi]